MVNLVIKIDITQDASKHHVNEMLDAVKREYSLRSVNDLLEGIEIKNTDTFRSGPELLATISVERV